MTELAAPELIDYVYKFGALPLLVYISIILWNKTGKLEIEISKLHEAQKNDLRIQAEELKSLHQNTMNVLNENRSFHEKAIERLDELKHRIHD